MFYVLVGVNHPESVGFVFQRSSQSLFLLWENTLFLTCFPVSTAVCMFGRCLCPVFRVMLYRLHVNSLLRERQVVALIDRFDVGRKGECGTTRVPQP